MRECSSTVSENIHRVMCTVSMSTCTLQGLHLFTISLITALTSGTPTLAACLAPGYTLPSTRPRVINMCGGSEGGRGAVNTETNHATLARGEDKLWLYCPNFMGVSKVLQVLHVGPCSSGHMVAKWSPNPLCLSSPSEANYSILHCWKGYKISR